MNGIASGLETERVRYETLLAGSAQRSIFAESWWLDIVTGSPDGWRPNLLLDGDAATLAAWPLPTAARTGFAGIGTGAPYTPFLGPLLPERAADANGISADIDLLERLAAQLGERYEHVEAACMPELTYWTPLGWHDFTHTTRTTWRLPKGMTTDDLERGLRKGTRSTRNAARRDELVVRTGTIDELLRACAATFERADSAVPARDVLERLARASLERERGEILAVEHPDGELLSAGLFVFDDRFTWSLANGRIARDGVTGAPTLLLWAAIERAMERGTGFDFEGSILKPVEKFVRGFGGMPHVYAVVRRSSPAWARHVARRRRVKRMLGR